MTEEQQDLRYAKARLRWIKWRNENPEKYKANRRRSNKSLSISNAKPLYRFTKVRHTCSKRGWVTDLTLETYTKIISNPCTYCFESISSETGSGLDRINNKLGYIISNVLPCCGSCNRIRGDNLTVEETKIAMLAVLEFRCKQKIA